MLLALKDSPLNSAFEVKRTINYDKFEKIRQFLRDYMVDFCRPGHIY